MTIKEDIQRLSSVRKTNDVEKFLSSYLKDRLVFGEDTAAIYADVYGELMGEDYTELFEGVDEKFNPDMLLEAGGVPDAVVKAIEDTKNAASGVGGMPNSVAKMIENTKVASGDFKGYSGMPNSIIKAINNYSASQANKGGFLSKIGNFLKGIKDSFIGSKVFDNFKEGLAWMVSPAGLPIVAGSAAGVGVIVAIVNALRKRGKNKEAEKLNAALEAAKKNKK